MKKRENEGSRVNFQSEILIGARKSCGKIIFRAALSSGKFKLIRRGKWPSRIGDEK